MVLPFGLGTDGETETTARLTGPHHPTAPPFSAYIHGHTQPSVSIGVPIIPSPYIDFIVVNGDDRFMIRCERKAVLENSVELAKIIHAGPNSGRKGDNHFQISNVDKQDFELVIRYLETKFVKYRDHLHILKILEIAVRYNCPDLVKHCIRELDLQLTSDTVIDIFRSLRYYQNLTMTQQPTTGGVTSPNGRSKSKRRQQNGSANEPNPNPFTTDQYAAALLNNTLQLIDMSAHLVLTKREICDLRFEELEMIATRDTLQLNNEMVLFTCLADWSKAECHRKNLDPDAENRRRVLGPLSYAPRYLLMSPSEFRRACDRIDLLDPAEIALVSAVLEGKKPKNLTNEQAQWLEKFRTPRPEYTKMPIHLSDRSNPKNYSKKMRQASEKRNQQEVGCCENFGLNCLAVFACIFD